MNFFYHENEDLMSLKNSTENGIYCIKDSKKYSHHHLHQTPLTPRHTIDAILGLNDRCDNIGGELLKVNLASKLPRIHE